MRAQPLEVTPQCPSIHTSSILILKNHHHWLPRHLTADMLRKHHHHALLHLPLLPSQQSPPGQRHWKLSVISLRKRCKLSTMYLRPAALRSLRPPAQLLRELSRIHHLLTVGVPSFPSSSSFFHNSCGGWNHRRQTSKLVKDRIRRFNDGQHVELWDEAMNNVALGGGAKSPPMTSRGSTSSGWLKMGMQERPPKLLPPLV